MRTSITFALLCLHLHLFFFDSCSLSFTAGTTAGTAGRGRVRGVPTLPPAARLCTTGGHGRKRWLARGGDATATAATAVATSSPSRGTLRDLLALLRDPLVELHAGLEVVQARGGRHEHQLFLDGRASLQTRQDRAGKGVKRSGGSVTHIIPSRCIDSQSNLSIMCIAIDSDDASSAQYCRAACCLT